MNTFAGIREIIKNDNELVHDEPFIVGFEYQIKETNRRQSIFLAEIKDDNDLRYLRIETTVIPLDHYDAEKCLRINEKLRIGYLAVGDLGGSPYIKMCHNIPYSNLNMEEVERAISYIARLADDFEFEFEDGADIF
ncbi:MAG: hypothetical protein IMF09_11110 [Proteobacteria bacterium]|nr:hypothetical protein [Pseudomonadota bacterium]